MIGLDTNVLARLFVDDDMAQARAARQFVGDRCSPRDPAFVDRVALCELVWVLTAVHRFGRAAVAEIVDKLLTTEEIALEDSASVQAALRTFRKGGVEFADALIGEVNRARGCTVTATFDRRAAKLEAFVRVS
jgi:predicted nucleic-acid-binding protein